MFGSSLLSFVLYEFRVLLCYLLFFNVHWCPTGYPYHMMFVSWFPVFWGWCCSIFSFLCSVLYINCLSFFFWPLYFPFSFGHCIFLFLLAIVFSFFFWPLYFPFFPPSIYGFWLPLWYLQSFRNSNTSGVTNGAGTTHLAEYLSAPPFKWGSCCTMFSLLYSIMSTIICLFLRPLYCLSFKVRCLITPFGHCIVCPSKYGVWLPPLAIVLSVLQSTASDYPFWYLHKFLFAVEEIVIFF